MDRNRARGEVAWCAIVALLAGVAAALGVFARGDGTFETVVSVRGVTYEMATSGVYAYNAQRMVSEGVGWDLFTLLVAVPALIATLPFVARGSFRGRLVALGLLGYFFYQYLEYSVTWAFGPLFPLFVATMAATLVGLVVLGSGVARAAGAARFDQRFPARSFATVSIGMAILLTLMWAQRIATGLSGELAAAQLNGETTMVVQALDLGLVVPAAVVIGRLAWRREHAGFVLAAAYAVMSVSLAAAIVAMIISTSAVQGQLELPPIVIFGGFVAAMATIGVRMLAGVAEQLPTAEIEAGGRFPAAEPIRAG